jgi:hypothetical protein
VGTLFSGIVSNMQHTIPFHCRHRELEITTQQLFTPEYLILDRLSGEMNLVSEVQSPLFMSMDPLNNLKFNYNYLNKLSKFAVVIIS